MTDMVDIIAPKLSVGLAISSDSKVIWVDVDGLCVLRICRIPALTVTDNRPTTEKEYDDPAT